MTRILIIEDELPLQRALADNFNFEKYEVLTASDGDTGYRLAKEKQPDVVILDLMLPRMSGYDVCRKLRAEGVATPILMLTARGEESDRVVGLDLGADDYVTKPFSPRELAARVRTVLRRAAPGVSTAERLAFGELEIDARTREVHRRGCPLELTAREFELLWFLASHPRQVFSRDLLMDRVWGYEAALDTGTVTVHIRRLREKIEEDPSQPRFLQTVWGVGYRFAP